MQLILIGPPGSGKGTQAKKIEKELGLKHISTGDLLRNNPNLTKEQKAIIDSGEFLSDEMILEIVKFELDNNADSGWILDGYPRTTNQANSLEKLLRKTPPTVLYFHVSDKELIERLTGRLSCGSCGSVFHKTANPPKETGICDNCGGPLTQRNDDKEKVVNKRLSIYHEKTKPIVDFYAQKNILQRIESGSGNSIDTIFSNILNILKR